MIQVLYNRVADILLYSRGKFAYYLSRSLILIKFSTKKILNLLSSLQNFNSMALSLPKVYH